MEKIVINWETKNVSNNNILLMYCFKRCDIGQNP